jgi:urate oxidase
VIGGEAEWSRVELSQTRSGENKVFGREREGQRVGKVDEERGARERVERGERE